MNFPEHVRLKSLFTFTSFSFTSNQGSLNFCHFLASNRAWQGTNYGVFFCCKFLVFQSEISRVVSWKRVEHLVHPYPGHWTVLPMSSPTCTCYKCPGLSTTASNILLSMVRIVKEKNFIKNIFCVIICHHNILLFYVIYSLWASSYPHVIFFNSGLHQLGLFRIAGNATRCRQLRNALEKVKSFFPTRFSKEHTNLGWRRDDLLGWWRYGCQRYRCNSEGVLSGSASAASTERTLSGLHCGCK